MTLHSGCVTIGDVAQVLTAINMQARLFGVVGETARILEIKLRALAAAIIDDHQVKGIQDFLNMDRTVPAGPHVCEAYHDLKRFAEGGI